MSNEKPMVSAYPPRPLPSREAGAMRGANPPRVRYSDAYPTGAERVLRRETKTTVAIYCGNQV